MRQRRNNTFDCRHHWQNCGRGMYCHPKTGQCVPETQGHNPYRSSGSTKNRYSILPRSLRNSEALRPRPVLPNCRGHSQSWWQAQMRNIRPGMGPSSIGYGDVTADCNPPAYMTADGCHGIQDILR